MNNIFPTCHCWFRKKKFSNWVLSTRLKGNFSVFQTYQTVGLLSITRQNQLSTVVKYSHPILLPASPLSSTQVIIIILFNASLPMVNLSSLFLWGLAIITHLSRCKLYFISLMKVLLTTLLPLDSLFLMFCKLYSATSKFLSKILFLLFFNCLIPINLALPTRV